jgi:hypothetical protein
VVAAPIVPEVIVPIVPQVTAPVVAPTVPAVAPTVRDINNGATTPTMDDASTRFSLLELDDAKGASAPGTLENTHPSNGLSARRPTTNGGTADPSRTAT